MIPPIMKTLVSTLSAIIALALVQPVVLAEAGTKNSEEPEPGEGGDSQLPAGYKGVVWGATTEAVQALRGRPLERMSTASSHVLYLIEAPLPGDKTTKTVVKWKFWDNELTEVHLLFEGPFNRTESREMIYKFESRYGEGRNEQRKQKQHYNWDAKTDLVIDEWWTWEDPFTTQMLKKNFEDNSFTVVRKSRVLEANRDRKTEEERMKAKTDRVQEIELD